MAPSIYYKFSTIMSAIVIMKSAVAAYSQQVTETELSSLIPFLEQRKRLDLFKLQRKQSKLLQHPRLRQQQRHLKKQNDNTASVTDDVNSQGTMSNNPFISNCTQSLLSNDNLEDGFLSQDEYAVYLYTLCPSCDSTTGFVGLPTSLQLSFLFAACSSEKDFDKCLEQMMKQGESQEQFGFRTKSKTFETDVGDLCTMIDENINKLIEGSESTSAPTNAPIKEVTNPPTSMPTDSPTHIPTNAPTKAPSNSPTKSPTDFPSKKPTLPPTGTPTQKPSPHLSESLTTGLPTFPPTSIFNSSLSGNEANQIPSLRPFTSLNITSPSMAPFFLNETFLNPLMNSTQSPTATPTGAPTFITALSINDTTTFIPSDAIATTTDLLSEPTGGTDNSKPSHYSVSVTFSYRVTLARELTASDIGFTPGVDNTVALDLLNGLMTLLQTSTERRILATSALDEKYSNTFVNHNIFFDVDDCPSSLTNPTHRCVVFLDTVAFDTKSKSEEEQARISQYLLTKVEGYMSPMSTQLVDTIENEDIVDVFFVGDGQAGRASDGVGVLTAIDRIDEVKVAGFPVPSYVVIVLAALILVLAAAFLVGRHTRQTRRKAEHENRQLVEGFDDDNTDLYAQEPSIDSCTIATNEERKSPNFKKAGVYLQFDPQQEEGAYVRTPENKDVEDDEFPDDRTQVASNVSGRSSKLLDDFDYSNLVTPFKWEDQDEESSSPISDPKEEVDVENDAAHESNWTSVWDQKPKKSSPLNSPKKDLSNVSVNATEQSVELKAISAQLGTDPDQIASNFPSIVPAIAGAVSNNEESATFNIESQPIDDEGIEVLERLIENDDWDCFASSANRYAFSPRELSVAGEDSSQQPESESEASASDSEICSDTVDDMDIKHLEELVEHDDWHGLSSEAKKYHQRYGSVCSSSCGPEESSQSECAQSSVPSNASSEGMEVIDDLIEQGNWDELAKFASTLAQGGRDEEIEPSNEDEHSSVWNDESHDLEIGLHVDLTSGTSSSGRSSESDPKITNLGFLESMAELSKSELDRSGSEGADMAAEWAISRSLTEIVNHEKKSTDRRKSAVKEKCDVEV